MLERYTPTHEKSFLYVTCSSQSGGHPFESPHPLLSNRDNAFSFASGKGGRCLGHGGPCISQKASFFLIFLGKDKWVRFVGTVSLVGWWSKKVGVRRTHCDVCTKGIGLVMQSPAVTWSSLARMLFLCFQHQNLLANTSLVTFWTHKVSNRRLDKIQAPKHWNHWRKKRINQMIQSRQRWFLAERFLASWLAYFHHQ